MGAPPIVPCPLACVDRATHSTLGTPSLPPTHPPTPAWSQAAGKKRMKSLGKVDVPQEAFMAVLSINQATTSTDD